MFHKWAVAGLVLAMAGCGSKPANVSAPVLDEASLKDKLRKFADDKHLVCETIWTESRFEDNKWMVSCHRGMNFQPSGFGKTKAEAIKAYLDIFNHEPQKIIDSFGKDFDAR